MSKNKLPQIAIIGRANVGKSTLFNRLIEKNKAIVSDIAGTTRDRNIDIVNWRDRQFTLIDTGGLDAAGDELEKEIIKQAEKAISRADLVLFLTDAKSGIMPADRQLAKMLVSKKLKHKTIAVVNKADNLKLRQLEVDFYKLNLGDPQPVSAANGSGCGDLLDQIIKHLPKTKIIAPSASQTPIKVAIVGRPNVGKSSILNSILGEERVIVTPRAHTTREAHDTEFSYKDHLFTLIDTAGISKTSKLSRGSLEKKSIDKSLNAIHEADVVMLVTDVSENIKEQDKKITQEILDSSKSVIIVANKWDLIPDKNTNTINKYKDYYTLSFPYLWWAPLIFTSAKDGLRSKKILDLIMEIIAAKKIQLTKSQLDGFLKTQIKRHRPSRGKGLKNPYIYYLEQVKTNPPRFLIWVNDPTTLHFSYIRFLQNNLREKFKIIGTPIQIEVQKWKAADKK